jgi:hypothetical protein
MLLPRDRQTLDKARKFLICEISEVMKESRDTAERQIDRALESKRTCSKATPLARRRFQAGRVYELESRLGKRMYARKVRIKLKADNVQEFRRFLDQKIIPLLRAQKDFRMRLS